MKVDLQGTKSELAFANTKKDQMATELKQMEHAQSRDFTTIEQLRGQLSEVKTKLQHADSDMQSMKSGKDMVDRQLKQVKEDLERANQ